MKRIFAVLLAAVLIVGLCSCKSATRYREIENYNLNEGLVATTDKETYPPDVDVIKITVKNISDEEICLGMGKDLLKKVDGEWRKVYYDKEIIVLELALILPALDEWETEFVMEDYFKYKLDSGEYCILIDNWVMTNSFTIE